MYLHSNNINTDLLKLQQNYNRRMQGGDVWGRKEGIIVELNSTQ